MSDTEDELRAGAEKCADEQMEEHRHHAFILQKLVAPENKQPLITLDEHSLKYSMIDCYLAGAKAVRERITNQLYKPGLTYHMSGKEICRILGVLPPAPKEGEK